MIVHCNKNFFLIYRSSEKTVWKINFNSYTNQLNIIGENGVSLGFFIEIYFLCGKNKSDGINIIV